jgi:hypothetical protein
MKGIANVAAASASNYRQGASSKDSYHLQLLNKENKALQNLLAAVELNRTSGGVNGAGTENSHPPIKGSSASGMMLRSTQMGSAKQQQHLQNLLH